LLLDGLIETLVDAVDVDGAQIHHLRGVIDDSYQGCRGS
jgi:hypothetical protein